MNSIKRIEIIIGLAILLGTSSCLGILCINGNGIIESETRSESGFQGIENTTSADVHFYTSENYSVIVEADENILPYIRTSVSSGILIIDLSGTRCIRTDSAPVVTVSGPDISEIHLSGSGDIFADSIFGETIEIYDSGSGNIIVNYAETSDLEIKNGGSGDISISEVYAEEARFKLSGSGDINVEGDVSIANITSTGSGNFNGDKLESQLCNTLISGSGNVFVYAEDELIATLTGSGNLYYKGDPTIYENISGSGRILNINK